MEPVRVAIVLALVFVVASVAWLRTRLLSRAPPRGLRIGGDEIAGGLDGHPLTAVQFKSRYCFACRETAAIIEEATPEVRVVQVDVRDAPHLVRRLNVVETPSLALVDEAGRVRLLLVGNPEPGELHLAMRGVWRSLEEEGAIRRRPHPREVTTA